MYGLKVETPCPLRKVSLCRSTQCGPKLLCHASQCSCSSVTWLMRGSLVGCCAHVGTGRRPPLVGTGGRVGSQMLAHQKPMLSDVNEATRGESSQTKSPPPLPAHNEATSRTQHLCLVSVWRRVLATPPPSSCTRSCTHTGCLFIYLLMWALSTWS